MKSWIMMMAAGLAALLGGLAALINPTGASEVTTLVVGWVMVLVAVLQAIATYRAETMGARLRAGGIAAALAFLGASLLLGPFGEGTVLRWLVGGLLIISGGAKVNAGRLMHSTDNRPLVFGTGAVSVLLGLVVLLGLNLNFGLLLAVELLSSGLGLVLLAMDHRKKT